MKYFPHDSLSPRQWCSRHIQNDWFPDFRIKDEDDDGNSEIELILTVFYPLKLHIRKREVWLIIV